MIPASPSPEYEGKLRDVLARGDWNELREFARRENAIPDEVYEKDGHFWEVLMHKLICNRIDMLAHHDASRTWLRERDYTTDIGGY